jgi:hypothetical protein
LIYEGSAEEDIFFSQLHLSAFKGSSSCNYLFYGISMIPAPHSWALLCLKLYSYFLVQLEYEGQEHTSRMVQQDQGVVVWGEAESIALTAVRPVGKAPFMLSLYGSRDKK